MYIDVTKSSWSHRYGKASAAVESFEAKLADVYDSNPGYRLCYKLRNMMQHVQLAGISIKFSRQSSSLLQPILMDRDALLKSYDSWGAVKADLLDRGPNFDLTPLLSDAQDGIYDIEAFILERTMAEMEPSLPDLIEAVESIDCPDGATRAIFSVERPDDPLIGARRLNVRLTLLPSPSSLRTVLSACRRNELGSLISIQRHEGHEHDEATSIPTFQRETGEAARDLMSAVLIDDKAGIDSILASRSRDRDAAMVLVQGLTDLSTIVISDLALLLGETPAATLARHTFRLDDESTSEGVTYLNLDEL